MAATMCAYNVFVGAETGLLKGIQTAERSWQNLNTADRAREITCLCYEGPNKAELCAGLRNNFVATFSLDSSEVSTREHGPFLDEPGHIKAIAKYDDRFVLGFSGGVVSLWSDGENENNCHAKLSTGDNLWAMAQCATEPNIIATGGKENPLKLWDLNDPNTPLFTSKNVRNDWLNLRVPVWETRVRFLGDGRKVVSGTGHQHVRVYDPQSSQRRPVINMDFLTHPVTALSVNPHKEYEVMVGNTFGDMGLLDLRTRRTVQLYKGFSGGITDIECHAAAPVAVSCGVDRFVRVHDIHSKALLDKFYLKSRLNCLLLSDDWPQNADECDQKVKKHTVSEEKRIEGNDEETADDAIWDTLDVVKTKTVNASETTKVGEKRKVESQKEERVNQKRDRQPKKKKRKNAI